MKPTTPRPGLELEAASAELLFGVLSSAVLARANLAGRGEVLVGDAVELADGLLGPGDAVSIKVGVAG